jgi:tRNA A37 threonylcarbamoyladenosine modification protein TsaB
MDTLVDAAARSQPRHGDPSAPELVIPWVDAKRGEVFAAMYGPQSNGTPGNTWAVLDGPVALEPDALLDRWADKMSARRVLVIGDGVPQTRALLDARLAPGSLYVDQIPPLAGVMAKMAGGAPWSEQAVMPHALRPVYVRRHYAALARDKMLTASQSGDRPDMDSASDPSA